jgi:hypothetical protein
MPTIRIAASYSAATVSSCTGKWPSFAVAQHICAAIAGMAVTGKKWKHFALRRVAKKTGGSGARSLRMVDTVPLHTAVETTWSIFCANHDVDVADSRRCLLERHLQGRCEARKEDVDELATFGRVSRAAS